MGEIPMLRQLGSPSLAPGTALALVGTPHAAGAVARTPIITGDGWVALLVIAVLVALIYVLIRGTLHIEDRDARFRRSHDDGWFGFFPLWPDDDESGHHHDDGGDGW